MKWALWQKIHSKALFIIVLIRQDWVSTDFMISVAGRCHYFARPQWVVCILLRFIDDYLNLIHSVAIHGPVDMLVFICLNDLAVNIIPEVLHKAMTLVCTMFLFLVKAIVTGMQFLVLEKEQSI